MAKKLPYKKLASLAVFRELYSENKDVYSVISEFAKDRIISKALHSFTLVTITEEINSCYGFDIPEYIIKTSLKRLTFLNRSQGKYHVESEIQEDFLLQKKQEDNQKYNRGIIDNLYTYIEKECVKKLDNNEKKVIMKSFCEFIADGEVYNKYSDIISAFILLNQDKGEFTERLDKIKEGVLLYTGLVFTDPSKIGLWDKELIIFVDTEILFHIGGFNGEVFHKASIDFLNLINEINVKSGKELVKLKYFEENKKEIEVFFDVAENIVDKRNGLRATSVAMENIVNGCKNKSDVALKLSDFYSCLKTNKIYKDTKNDYFEEYNHKYNIIGPELLCELESTYNCEDLRDNMRLLDYINIIRKGRAEFEFEDSKCVLLTGNRLTLKLAKNPLVRTEYRQNLAVDLEFVINKIWFKLNKGLSSKGLPNIFSVISKAQIVLSTHLNDRVKKNYEEAKKEYNLGNVTEEQLSARIIDLRQKTKLPEEINKDNIEVVLDNINEDTLQNFCEEQELFKRKAKKNEDELEKVKTSHSIQIIIEKIKVKQEYLYNMQEQYDLEKMKKEKIDIKINRRIKTLKFVIIGLCIILYFVIVLSCFKLGWCKIEPILFLLGLIPSFFTIIFLVIKEKTFNPKRAIKSLKGKISNRFYNKLMFDIDNYKNLSGKIDSLSFDIQALEKEKNSQTLTPSCGLAK
ncbi:MAG: hypothetical protein JEY96_19340 [Bacteroidales bacterium]|nr:hypothetical protein [Bacteroidales bacterium]